jgi:hypothetical protein
MTILFQRGQDVCGFFAQVRSILSNIAFLCCPAACCGAICANFRPAWRAAAFLNEI